MASCDYHPLTAANYFCDTCAQQFCSQCVDRSDATDSRCFHCQTALPKVITADSVDPFWRYLEKAFRYPLNSQGLAVIVGLSVASIIVSQLPLSWLVMIGVNLLLFGLSVNYGFMCLRQTSEGNMVAPGLQEDWTDAIVLLWKSFLLLVGTALILIRFGGSLDRWYVGVFAGLSVLAIPAMLMIFAQTKSVRQALSPIQYFGMIWKIGLPYGLLLILLLIMGSSLGVLQSVIGSDFSLVSTVVESSVSYYYVIVMFHLMGYVLYQYQEKLGYSTAAGEDYGQADVVATTRAHVRVCLKEGDYARADNLYQSALKQTPQNAELVQEYFTFLIRTARRDSLSLFAEPYFLSKIQAQRLTLLASDFKQVLRLLPAYLPKNPLVRYRLAAECYAAGDAKLALRLINGIHKQAPDFEHLLPACELMQQAMLEIPELAAKAGQCAQLIEQVKRRQANAAEMKAAAAAAANPIHAESRDEPPPRITGKAQFGSRELSHLQLAPLDEGNQSDELAPIEFRP